MKTNILLTSAGRRSYIVKYFQEALGGRGLVHAANSEWSPALQVADKAVTTPLIYDSTYIDFLLDYSLKHDINAIISLFDIDLPVLAQSKRRFDKNGIQVVVSDYNVTQICNDKWKAFEFFKNNNINTPKTYISISDAVMDLKNGNVSYPLIIKPRWGMGSIGIYTAENINELEILYIKVKTEILKTYLKFESKEDLNKAVLIQEKLNGQEYGLDVVNDLNKIYVTTFVKRKLAMRSGETDQAITEDNQTLRDFGEKISFALQHIGNLDADCFVVNHTPYMLEMNCRFGGGYPFSHLAGANIPQAIISWLNNEKPPKDVFEIEYGVEAIKDINLVLLENH